MLFEWNIYLQKHWLTKLARKLTKLHLAEKSGCLKPSLGLKKKVNITIIVFCV